MRPMTNWPHRLGELDKWVKRLAEEKDSFDGDEDLVSKPSAQVSGLKEVRELSASHDSAFSSREAVWGISSKAWKIV